MVRFCISSIFWIVSGLVFLVNPSFSQEPSLLGNPNDAPLALEGSTPGPPSNHWAGLPYFNSAGNRGGSGEGSSDLAGPATFPTETSLDRSPNPSSPTSHQTSWSRGDSEESLGKVAPFSGESEATLSNLVGFQTPSEDHSSPLWRYHKLFSASSADQEPEAELTSPYGELSLILTPAVEKNIRYFQTVIPDRFQQWLSRFYRYKPAVEQIFEELGIPQELVYLSLVESGFNPRAYSRARAAGPWQFMKATGRIYGLRVNWYIDERRDPVKSSVAAAQHLRDLYDRFGSWPLALAAYNAGSGKISRAIKKTGSRDFWKIAKTRYIRRETRQYVPKFMAATIIASNPALFGFHAEVSDLHDYDEVLISNTVHLKSIAKETGIELETLRNLNPELRRSITPPTKDGYFLKVPVGLGPQVSEIREQIAEWKEPPVQVTTYRVRRGDSLSVIAKRFRMSIQKLKDLNNLSGHMIHVGQKLRVSSMEASDSSDPEDVQWYRVRKGDSLWAIAQRYRVSIGELKILNNLRSSFIQVGHLLKVSR